MRKLVNKRIREDDLTWMNACSQDENHHPDIVAHTCFDYTQVYSLYQFSENLERWCKQAQAWVRANAGVFHSRPGVDAQGNATPPQALSQAPNFQDFTLMIYIAPDYTLRILNSHPQYVSLQFHKAFRSIYSLPRWVDYGLHVVYEGDLAKGQEFFFARQPNEHFT